MTDQEKEVFTSLLEACEALQEKGYKISKSKIYRDADTGKITREPDGTIKALAAWNYAKTHLERIGDNKEALKNLQKKKLLNAIKIQEADIRRKNFEQEKEEGKYLPRRDFEAELAARVVVFSSMFQHLFNTRVQEWISLVDGNKAKAADLLTALNESRNELLNEYANTKSFQVLFEDGPDEEES